MNSTRCFVVAVAVLGVMIPVHAQDVQPPSDLASLYSTIKAQEANFPLPNTTETVTVGTLDLTNVDSAKPRFRFAIPTYNDGSFHVVFVPIPPGEDVVNHQTAFALHVPNVGGQVTVANILHLNIRFAITVGGTIWRASGSSSVTLQLGSQVRTVPPTATEVVFEDVTSTSPSLAIAVNGALITNGQPQPLPIQGLLPVRIDWRTVGAGAVTIPVLPVAIIYAPVVDAQKKNQASSAQSTSVGNTTTIGFTTQNSTSVPIDSQFQTVSDVAKGMNALGGLLKLTGIPIATTIGGALSYVSSGLGTSSATQTNSTAVTSQHALAVTNTGLLSQTALSSQGGPGVGDIITYYYNARVLWYSENGRMTLAMLGFDGLAQPTVQQLKTALIDLQTQPTGTKHAQWKADSSAIESLLQLDPFVAGGAAAVLLPPRFVDVSHGAVEMGGGTMNYTATHTVTSTDLSTRVNTITKVENDNTGFLSFLGLGVTQTQGLQSQISQSNSSQDSTTKTVSQQYTLNGNGNEYYSCEVYFDAVFGSFAFRDVTSFQGASAISGIVTNGAGEGLPDVPVVVTAGSRTFLTHSDAHGTFKLRLPGVAAGHLELASEKATGQVEYLGMPLTNVKLERP
jgi:hypothetical protein